MSRGEHALSSASTTSMPYLFPFLASLCLHGLLASFFMFHWESPPPPIVNKGETIIHAVAIEDTQLEAIKKQQESQKQQIELAKQRQLDAEQRQQERVKKAAEEKAVAEQQARAAEAEAKIKQQQKRIAEKAVALALKKKAAEEQKKIETEKAAKALQEKQQQFEAAAALQKKMAAKQAALAQQRAQAIHGIVDQYKGLILEAISKQWLVPADIDATLSCQLMIKLGPQGRVQAVQLIKSSHNTLLDQSAIAAVYKASPLPVPADKDAAAIFAAFSLTLKPEQMLEN